MSGRNSSAAAPARVGDLTPAPYNPRTISETKLAALGKAMRKFGDLSSIVFNRRTGLVVGGHQRLKHLPPDAPIEITERRARPDRQGTIARGYIDVGGKRWPYREVDWGEDTERAANIAANRHGGDWDLSALGDLLGSLSAGGFDMELTGFDGDELAELLRGGAPPNLDPGEGRYQEQYGVIVVCESEQDQERIYNQLHEEGFNCKVVTT